MYLAKVEEIEKRKENEIRIKEEEARMREELERAE